MKKLLILCVALSSANAFAWGCDESQAGKRLIERVERIRNDCAENIKQKLKKGSHFRVEGRISMCKLGARNRIMESILSGGPTAAETEEASYIIDNYESDIKRQLGL